MTEIKCINSSDIPVELNLKINENIKKIKWLIILILQKEVQEDVGMERLMYLSDGNVLVVNQQSSEPQFEELEECQVSEEIITGEWEDNCAEEIGKLYS